jgi:hypothetical protein
MQKEQNNKPNTLNLGDKLSEEDKILLHESLRLHSETIGKFFKLFIVVTICFCVTLAMIVGTFLLYLYQYDFSSETTTTTTTTEVEQSTEGGGDANYIGRDGEINYGQADSQDNDNNNYHYNKTNQEGEQITWQE